MDFTPESVDACGRIRATDEDGNAHIFHTDPAEIAEAIYWSGLKAGALELGLLLYGPDGDLRPHDGRTTPQLLRDWLEKVTTAGLDREDAAVWFFDRIRRAVK